MNEDNRCKIIVFEGGDGAGKTTQQQILAERLKAEGKDVLCLHEPTDGYYGQRLKRSATEGRLKPDEEISYFILDIYDDDRKNIRPYLHTDKVILMDRYYFSTIAYHGGRHLDADTIRILIERFAPPPDLVLLLDVDPEIAVKRIKKRDKPNHFEELEYLKEVRGNFLAMEDECIVKIDAARKVEEVSEEIYKQVKEVL